MTKGKLASIIILTLFVAGPVGAATTCPEGFVLETNAVGQQNCRNLACDSGINMYGEHVDGTWVGPQPSDFYGGIERYIKDFAGMPKPKVKGPDGKWVGWSVGAIQCPPDPIGLHPNPDWPCGFDYCDKQVQNMPALPTNLNIRM